MNLRPFRLCLFLLAPLGAGRAVLATDPPRFLPREVRLELAPGSASTLPIDIEAVAQQVCDDLPGAGPRGSLSKCSITPTASLTVEMVAWDSGSAVRVLQFLSASTVVTTCGTWDSTLALDPAQLQPSSPLAFEEASEAPGSGGLSGGLEMIANLHLANRDTGQTADFSQHLALSLAGSWASASADGSDPTDPNDFLVYFDGHCVPISSLDDAARDSLSKVACPICLTSGAGK